MGVRGLLGAMCTPETQAAQPLPLHDSMAAHAGPQLSSLLFLARSTLTVKRGTSIIGSLQMEVACVVSYFGVSFSLRCKHSGRWPSRYPRSRGMSVSLHP